MIPNPQTEHQVTQHLCSAAETQAGFLRFPFQLFLQPSYLKIRTTSCLLPVTYAWHQQSVSSGLEWPQLHKEHFTSFWMMIFNQVTHLWHALSLHILNKLHYYSVVTDHWHAVVIHMCHSFCSWMGALEENEYVHSSLLRGAGFLCK